MMGITKGALQMRGLYYHPKRVTDKDSNLMLDSNTYHAVSLFLELIEDLVPEICDELKGSYSNYEQAYRWFKTNQKSFNVEQLPWPSEWKYVKHASKNQFKEYLDLKDSILSWVDKFNLQSYSDFYAGVGLTALSFYYDDCQPHSRKKKWRELKAIAKQYNVAVEQLKQVKSYRLTWPNEEKLSLSESVFFEEEDDTVELSRAIGLEETNYNLFFEQIYPFALAPGTISGVLNQNVSLGELEWMSFHYEGLVIPLILQNDKEEFHRLYESRDLIYTGLAWDPREKTWKEFETVIDNLYKQYKKLYRDRTETFLQEQGYIKQREKRVMVHFKWLVHYQIQGWSLAKIAEHYNNNSKRIYNEDTIYHGITNAAELALLRLRRKK
ncbi:hypothetical protein [Paenibacillus hubeiensis]|uniref:hypothetical protein n=1 Tax=Paenibacillus hubeiensis TaxID=3077330 RepID=UPI0031BA2F54